MKEKILKLREEGKTYNQIREILGCSKGTISYHCGDGQKDKTLKRRKKRRENVLIAKVDNFKYVKYGKDVKPPKKDKARKNVVEAIREFQKSDSRSKGRVNRSIKLTFNWEDVIKTFGEDTNCYLSGEQINLYENDYQLDHKLPVSRGGDNSLNNMGITHKIVNRMKHNLTPEEFIGWCKKILEYNGYNVTKK